MDTLTLGDCCVLVTGVNLLSGVLPQNSQIREILLKEELF